MEFNYLCVTNRDTDEPVTVNLDYVTRVERNEDGTAAIYLSNEDTPLNVVEDFDEVVDEIVLSTDIPQEVEKTKYTPCPCDTCPRESLCNSTTGGGTNGKDCRKWRAWFRIAWREAVEPLREALGVKKGKRK